MIPYEARFHISDTSHEKEDQVMAIARDAETDLLRVVRSERGDEQGYLGGTFIDFVPRQGVSADEATVAQMYEILEDADLLEALNSIEGVSVAAYDR